MPTEKTPIYLVNFESYLKPKVRSKQVQRWASPPTKQLQEETSSFYMFCETSSIHGLSMLALTKTASIYERRAWQIIIFTSIIASALILYESTIINARTPTVTHIESTHYPGYTVPFPAVSLCNLNRISKQKGLKLAQKFASTTDLPVSEIIRLFEVPFQLKEDTHTTQDDFKKFDDVLKLNNYTLLQYFMAITPDCMEDLVKCKWKGRTAPCDSLFEPVLVTRGRCCSFNYYARPVNRSSRNIQSFTPEIPRHVAGCGADTGLTVLLDPQTDDYMAAFLKSPGYRIIVHDAYDFPEDNSDNEFLSLQTETYVGVRMEVTYGTNYLRNMDFARRGCIFDSEYKLNYFNKYSYWNCLAECLSLRVLAKCGCIPPHMVRYSMRELCNVTQFDCTIQESEHFKVLAETTSILGTKICGCMPDCSFNQYRTTTSSGMLNRTFAKGLHRFFKNVTITDQILLHVFFADLTSILYRMDALESWQSIVGTVGGITGIVMGFSVVSLSEAIFFFCARPFYMKCVKLLTWVKVKLINK